MSKHLLFGHFFFPRLSSIMKVGMIIGGVLYDSNVFKIFYLILIVIAITPRMWRLKRQVNTMSPQEKR